MSPVNVPVSPWGRPELSDTVAKALASRGIIGPDLRRVRRVVIDLTAGEVARLYVETYGDSRLVDSILACEFDVLEEDRAA